MCSTDTPTSETSMPDRGTAEWTYSPEDSPASHSPWPDIGEAPPTSAIYGHRCCESYKKLPHATSWQKTFAASLVGQTGWYSSRCSLIWRLRATKSRRRLYFLLQVSTRRTSDSASGLLRTPAAQESGIKPERLVTKDGHPAQIGERAYDRHTGRLAQIGLTQQVALIPTVTVNGNNNRKGLTPKSGDGLATYCKMLPTPTASDADGAGCYGKGDPKLGLAIKLLPTPTTPRANDSDNTAGKYYPTQKQPGLSILTAGTDGQLNPQFVEEMMGYPIGWTE